MKTMREKRKLKINTVYLNAINNPSTAHFTLESIGEWEIYKNHALILTIESIFYQPLLNAWNNKELVEISATFVNNYNLQKTEIKDITGVRRILNES